jgi:hypothetical protein
MKDPTTGEAPSSGAQASAMGKYVLVGFMRIGSIRAVIEKINKKGIKTKRIQQVCSSKKIQNHPKV